MFQSISARLDLRRSGRFGISLLVGACLGVTAGTGVRWASAATNPNCIVTAAVGYKNCISTGGAFLSGSAHRISSTGVPYQMIIRNQQGSGALQWGPFGTWYDQVWHYVPKQASWDWVGSVATMINNLGTANGGYETTIQ